MYITTVTTEGKSKPPQIGTEYSNEYVAEPQKQGLPMEEVIKRVTERDEMAQASPALVGDRLLIRTEQRLYSIRRKT